MYIAAASAKMMSYFDVEKTSHVPLSELNCSENFVQYKFPTHYYKGAPTRK
jgi:hypothetical protein